MENRGASAWRLGLIGLVVVAVVALGVHENRVSEQSVANIAAGFAQINAETQAETDAVRLETVGYEVQAISIEHEMGKVDMPAIPEERKDLLWAKTQSITDEQRQDIDRALQICDEELHPKPHRKVKRVAAVSRGDEEDLSDCPTC